MRKLRVVVLKASKYGEDGYVERFWRGFMPNATIAYIRSLIPTFVGDTEVEVHTIDEYVHTDLDYLDLLERRDKCPTLLLLVGVQSHQFQRALDLGGYAAQHGCMVVMGGPHPMTCDTSIMHGRGVSFSLSEAEVVLSTILDDAVHGQLQDIYGAGQRWAAELDPPILIPPSTADLRRCVVPMLGVYPYRGCPFTCNFCAIIKIAGRRVRGQPLQTTIETLRSAKAAGVRMVMFTCDNFNKIPGVRDLLKTIIAENVAIPFFCQCDTQIAQEPDLVALMAQAGCFDIFLGVESFDRTTLLAAHKTQNDPKKYRLIVENCSLEGISSHFSNIIGFRNQRRADVLDHLRQLKELGPSLASFYILCPIPGTEQYDDFRRQGIISERNLDRFDGNCAVWDHEYLSKEERRSLFLQCYREFFTVRHVREELSRRHRRRSLVHEASLLLGYTAFSRYCTFRGLHPMSGGVGRRRLDHVNDYLAARIHRFGFGLVPLPDSLKLSAADERLNKVNLRVVNE